MLCFNLVHHLTSDQTVDLFGRIHDSLAPGGLLAVMDPFAQPSRHMAADLNLFGLFVYLGSGSRVNTPARLYSWLCEAGFGAPRRIRILRIPGQAIYVVSKTATAPSRSKPAGRP